MRLLALMALPLALAACQSEPDFDERYEKANADIAAKVKALDEAAAKADAEILAAEGGAGQASKPQMSITKDGKPQDGTTMAPVKSGL